MADPEKRDLVLPPGSYAFVQDETKGQIRTFVGPVVINQTGQDRPVKYDHAQREYQAVTLRDAQEKMPLAQEGDYIVLENPASNAAHPQEGSPVAPPELKIGSKVNIPGPCSFALWPGQCATVVKGHNLRSNHFLLVRVYNEQAAKENWSKAVMKSAESTETQTPTTDVEKLNLVTGKLLVIKGTEVSFYIPPTGVEVVAENGQYVREAVTLEQLEYAILVGESGEKRYERGPQVVFPQPTERFFTEDNARKFMAFELTPIQGIHVKVIAPYEENDRIYGEGEELFITGNASKENGTAIYFPRPEHSIVQYGDKKKHYATAIPEGEGRYVMNRLTGEIETHAGPDMFLPDPRTQVFVRRVLSDKEVSLWYPGNTEALAYNQNLRSVMQNSGSGRAGYVEEAMLFNASLDMLEAAPARPLRAAASTMADVFTRSTTYSPPRQITIDSKYDGVPRIGIWVGYAVMVVSANGSRRVEVGPKTILLNYDETLEVLELSTGKPKTTDTLQRSVYLRVKNNKVSDIIGLETSDQIPVAVKLSYRVNFDGDPNKWFEVENYVKFLCDHARSKLKGEIRKLEIEEFSADGVAFVRNILLGEKDAEGHRPLLSFPENGMTASDIEVLEIKIENAEIAKMLHDAQYHAVSSNIALGKAEKQLSVTKRTEEIVRETERTKAETQKLRAELEIEEAHNRLLVNLKKLANQFSEIEQRVDIAQKNESLVDIAHESELARQQAQQKFKDDLALAAAQLRLMELQAETNSVTERFRAAQAGFSEALLVLSNQDTLQKVVQAGSIQTMIGGPNLVEAIQKILVGTGLDEVGKKLVAGRLGNGSGTPAIPANRP